MAEAVGLVFILLGILAVSVVVFSAWLLLWMVKLVFKGLFGIFSVGGPPALPSGNGVTSHRCSRQGCMTVNPASARFCRLCGRYLVGSMVMRRAAVW